MTSALFVQWLKERNPRGLKVAGEWDQARARAWVKWRLQIESLSELDKLEDRADAFHRIIRKPFMEWQGNG